MGFVSDALGTKNNYQATAPTNQYRAQSATLDQASYADAIKKAQAAAAGGLGTATGTGGQQGQLAQMLTDQAQGKGVNPALAQLNQTTNKNIQQSTGMIASQKGINPALAARTAAMTGASANQTAAGQAATQTANQQLSTQSLLANALQAQRGQDISQQQAATQLLGTSGQLQNQQNQVNLSNLTQQQQLNAAVAAQNANLQQGANQINANVATGNASTNAAIAGGVMQGAGAAVGMMADGGQVPDAFTVPAIPAVGVPSGMSAFDSGMSALGKGAGKAFAKKKTPGAPVGGGDGGSVGAMLAEGGELDGREGGHVPGAASVAGDSYRNDTVDAKLSPGEIVLPRSVSQSPDAAAKAAAFVAAIKAGGKGRSAGQGFGRALGRLRELDARIGKLERLADGGEVGERNPEIESIVEATNTRLRDLAADEARSGAEAINSALPDALSARSGILADRNRKKNLLDANWENR